MKFFVKLMIAAVVLAVLAPFTVLKGKDGKPLMSFSDLKMPDLAMPKVPDAVKDASLPKSGGKDVIYKWKDAKGVLHFSSKPPAAGIEYTSKGYDPNTNLIQSVEIEEEKPASTMTTEAPKIEKPSDLANVYSPDKIEKLMKDANNVQKLLNQRNQKLNAMMGDN